MKVHGIELSKKEEGVVRYFFDLTCHYLAVMQKSGSYYLFDFQAGGERRVGAGDIRFHRNPCYLEVTAADLPYLKKPEGEWEFRKLEVGDDYLIMANGSNGHGSMFRDSISGSKGRNRLNGFRWCAPREVDAFEVWWNDEGSGIYPIDGHDMEEHAHRVGRIAWENGAYKAQNANK